MNITYCVCAVPSWKPPPALSCKPPAIPPLMPPIAPSWKPLAAPPGKHHGTPSLRPPGALSWKPAALPLMPSAALSWKSPEAPPRKPPAAPSRKPPAVLGQGCVPEVERYNLWEEKPMFPFRARRLRIDLQS